MVNLPASQTSEGPATLVVDLDGTLIRSDMLYESFWSAFSLSWKAPFVAARALSQGRAALKRRMTELAVVDPAHLPYRAEVLDHIRSWRQRGGRVALVTASDQHLAERIAAHVGLFDAVHGSDGRTNLKGAEKARFLDRLYGSGGYAYMGDSRADLEVWKQAGRAITVGAAPALRQQVETLGHPVEHLATERRLKPYLAACRPHQWLKNILVFLPVLAAHRLEAAPLLHSLLAFLAFSLVASSVYVLNDLLDLAADRTHPRKRFRPMASGDMPIAHGTILAPALLLAGVLLTVPLGPRFLLVMAVYYVLTLAYSLVIKRHPVIDICTLAGLYTLRILAGGAATDIPLSVWLLAFSIFFFFSMAAVKRQAELIDSARRGTLKAAGRGYRVEDLAVVSQMATASGFVSVLVMALYVNSPAISKLYHNPDMLWGICLILLYWIGRVSLITHRGDMHDDPIVFAIKDRISLLCGLLVVVQALLGVLR